MSEKCQIYTHFDPIRRKHRHSSHSHTSHISFRQQNPPRKYTTGLSPAKSRSRTYPAKSFPSFPPAAAYMKTSRTLNSLPVDVLPLCQSHQPTSHGTRQLNPALSISGQPFSMSIIGCLVSSVVNCAPLATRSHPMHTNLRCSVHSWIPSR